MTNSIVLKFMYQDQNVLIVKVTKVHLVKYNYHHDTTNTLILKP